MHDNDLFTLLSIFISEPPLVTSDTVIIPFYTFV